ncbi:MAG: molybdopterin synthase sulfurylase MoeB [Pseudomonadota bacterium]
MIRSTLRRLLGRAPTVPDTSPPPPPVARVAPPSAPPPEEDEPQLELDGPGLRAWVDAGKAPLLLDVRELGELESGYAATSFLMPMNEVPSRLQELPKDRPIIVMCAAGVRSFGVAHYLREQGLQDAWSLAGGVSAWIHEGGEHVVPPRKDNLRLLSPVRVKAEVCAARGLGETALGGVVQAITGAPGDWRYAVRVAPPQGGSISLEGLAEADLDIIGVRPRGAAR